MDIVKLVRILPHTSHHITYPERAQCVISVLSNGLWSREHGSRDLHRVQRLVGLPAPRIRPVAFTTLPSVLPLNLSWQSFPSPLAVPVSDVRCEEIQSEISVRHVVYYVLCKYD